MYRDSCIVACATVYRISLEFVIFIHCKNPDIHGYSVASFPYFNGTVGPGFIIPSIYGYKRTQNRFR